MEPHKYSVEPRNTVQNLKMCSIEDVVNFKPAHLTGILNGHALV